MDRRKLRKLSRVNLCTTEVAENKEEAEPLKEHGDESVEREKPIDLWRRKALIVKRLCSVCLTLRKYAVEAGLINNFVVSVTSRRLHVGEGDETEELEWDLDHFRANKEIRVPRKTVEILEKLPSMRTAHDIQVIGNLMRSLPSFRKYTSAMQLMMCRIVRYMRCSSRRVVLRKGHQGYSVYFIVTGSVSVVMDRDDQNVFVKPEVVILRKGACFGEIALLQNTKRNATIVCADDSEFLVIDKEDFIQNGLNERLDDEFTFRYNFYRNWEPIESWSDEKIKALAYCSRTEDYSYNKVIVSGIVKNEFLWFVVKGSCGMLKLVNINEMEEYTQLQALPAGVQSYVTPYKEDVEEDRDQHQHLAQSSQHRREQLNDNNSVNSDHRQRVHRRWFKDEVSMPESTVITADNSSMPYTPTSADSFSTKNTNTTHTSTSKSSNSRKQFKTTSVQNNFTNRKETKTGVFIQMDQLRDGQCFGLEQLYDENSNAKLCLVSKNCVIIHVPRKKFQELADKKSLIKIHAQIKEYPSDKDLINNFFKRRLWENYKQNLIEDVVMSRLNGKCSLRDRDQLYDQYEKNRNFGEMSYGMMLDEKQTKTAKYRIKSAIESVYENDSGKRASKQRVSTAALSRPKTCNSLVGATTYSYISRPNTAFIRLRPSKFPACYNTERSKTNHHLKSRSSIVAGSADSVSTRMSTKLSYLKSQSFVLPKSRNAKEIHGVNIVNEANRNLRQRNEKFIPKLNFEKDDDARMFSSRSSVWIDDETETFNKESKLIP